MRRLSVRLTELEERQRLPRPMAAPAAAAAEKPAEPRISRPTAAAAKAATQTTPAASQTPDRPEAATLPPRPEADSATAPSVHAAGGQGAPQTVRRLDPVPESSLVDVAVEKIKTWVLGGNPVTRIGLVVLFCGIAFLLKYAAVRNLLPIELRLVGVMAAGIALVVLGWRLREGRRTYALLLQGGGVGVVYLTLYAAAKLYHLLPLPLCLLLMLALVGFSAALAILQNALPLAQFGTMGGFLAPVLMSTGSGSHVLLFSYYALLNAGVFAIAWYRSWRSLNLTGFFFTFGIGSLWGATGYAPRHFASTEPFLLLFFCFYGGISILYALRQPPRFKGIVDGTLVFGLPLVVFALQSAMVHRYPYGLAFSALGLGAFYVLLAAALWRRHGVGLRMLVEAFIALGVVFASVAIPLGLDDQWTTAAWAMEGAALVWVGVRQARRLARWMGLLLQAGAGLFFLEGLGTAGTGIPVINGIFLGGVLISAAGLFSGVYLHRHREGLFKQEQVLPTPVALWGLLWWLGIGIFEIQRQAPADAESALTIGFLALSFFALLKAYRRIEWPVMVTPLLALLPAMGILGLWELTLRSIFLSRSHHLLTGVGLIAWPLAFAIQYRLLCEAAAAWPERLSEVWHTGSLLLLTVFAASEVDWLLRYVLDVAGSWRLAVLMGVLIAPLALLLRLRKREFWPLAALPRVYAPDGWAPRLFAALAWALCLLAGLHDGDPSPLAYLPLLNPVEIGQLAILVVLAAHLWLYAGAPGSEADRGVTRGLTWALAAVVFIFLNVVVARSVHHFAGVSYGDRLLGDGRLHAALSILWAILALGAMAWGARHRQRPVWFAGAGLLGCGVAKLFFVDLAGSGSISRIVSFLAVGGLMLLIGFFAPVPGPLPPADGADKTPNPPQTSPAPETVKEAL
ncbi:MAG: DUF2339 domain-containing protein [Desulfosarcinaceae bacterium]